MKIAVISNGGFLLDLAYLLKLEGHTIDMYVQNLQALRLGQGLLGMKELSRDVSFDGYDMIIVDDVYYGNVADKLRKEGKIVVGGSVDTDVWENNRFVGMEVMKRCGIDVPETHDFDSYEDAYEFASESDKLYVVKHSGKEGLAKGKTIVPVSRDEMLYFMSKLKDVEGLRFILQEKIEGIEIAMGAWFNGKEFVGSLNYNLEHKRMFTGDMGALCGESGTVSVMSEDWYLFYEKGLGRCKEFLRRAGYVGYIDLNCILTEDGKLYGLEFTCRPGWPIFQIMVRQWKFGNTGEMLYKVGKGEKIGNEYVDKNKRYGVGVCFFTETQYGEVPITVEGVNSDNVDENIIEWLGLDDVWFDRDNGMFVSVTGSQWYSRNIVAVGVGKEFKDAQKRAYDLIGKVSSTFGWYRLDVGERYNKQADIVREYIKDF
jgi:phosphoribosylamine--glycine ligase